jgi:hypothetical protein
MIKKFWSQPNQRYRNFQIAYTILTLNFLFPAVSYLFQPEMAVRSLTDLGMLFGYSYPVSEESHLWRILAVGNVLTLSFSCFLLQWNLVRFYPVLVPLVFMKLTASFGFLGVFLFVTPHPSYLGIFLLDGVTASAMLYFAIKAHRSLPSDPSLLALLVPKPRSR